jgi:hypothetical protein
MKSKLELAMTLVERLIVASDLRNRAAANAGLSNTMAASPEDPEDAYLAAELRKADRTIEALWLDRFIEGLGRFGDTAGRNDPAAPQIGDLLVELRELYIK